MVTLYPTPAGQVEPGPFVLFGIDGHLQNADGAPRWLAQTLAARLVELPAAEGAQVEAVAAAALARWGGPGARWLSPPSVRRLGQVEGPPAP